MKISSNTIYKAIYNLELVNNNNDQGQVTIEYDSGNTGDSASTYNVDVESWISVNVILLPQWQTRVTFALTFTSLSTRYSAESKRVLGE